MLRLKCNICLNTLIDQDSGPVAAPCGHIYCQACLDAMSKTRDKTNCAFCRHPFPVAAALKLFVEYEEFQPNPAPPLTASQTEAGNAFIKACERVDEKFGEDEALKTIVSAEKLLTDIEGTHGNSDAEKILKLISASLEDLRKRLKLFSRMNALQQENATLQQERDSLRLAVVAQLREADEAAQAQTKLVRHLKRANSELEVFQTRQYGKQQANSRTVQELTEELQAERMRSAKYKKKYHATLQKLKGTGHRSRKSGHIKPATGHLTSETEFSDDSLEIISLPNSQIPSESVIKASLRRQIMGSSETEAAGAPKGKRKVVQREGVETQVAGPSRKKVKLPISPSLDIVQEDSLEGTLCDHPPLRPRSHK